MRSLTLPLLSPGAKKRLFPPPPLSFHPPIRHGALNSCRSVAPAARRLALVRVDVDPGEIFWRKGNTVFPLLSWNTGGQIIVFFDWRNPLLVKITRSRPPCFRTSLLDYGSRVLPWLLSLSLRGLKSSGAKGNLLGHRERFTRNTADAGYSRARVRDDKCSRLFFLALSSANMEDITDVSSACLINHIAKSIVELLKVLFKKRETSEAAPKFSGKKTRHRASRSLSTPRFRISALHSERRKRAPMPLLPALFSKRVYDSKSVFGKEKEICVDEHHRNGGREKICVDEHHGNEGAKKTTKT